MTDPHHTAIPYLPKHVTMARELVAKMRAHDGLTPVDLERFWADQEIAIENPFGADIPQVALGAHTTAECVYDELGIPEDYWRYDHDEEWRLSLNKAYNDNAEKIVGKRLLPEPPPASAAALSDASGQSDRSDRSDASDASLKYPDTKGLHDIFEARNEWHDRSWWLKQSAHNEDELKALLDRVEARDVRSFILPPDWEKEKARLRTRGIKPPLYRGQRGPVTFATSIYGPENLLFLIMMNPDLAARLRDAILAKMLELARVLDEEAGYTPETAPHGFSFCDDNCCLLSPDMYEFFGWPILKGMFDRYSPNPGDTRYQHSDSAMGHLLPLLGKLNMTGVNFGPTLTIAEIRQHLPGAIIYGQLAPFTYCRNEAENIVLETLRDIEMAKENRGLVFATAGSVNNGSRLTSMRLIMATLQRYGRYI
ncbi:MAG: hypothetical protein NTX50_15275 [Candidatus Sumerlaeota bacterium]|nr:hypothetical protein [Candidatus Sumerlaeota bacterium]